MFQFYDRISQKIEMLFSDYEIGVNMGQKAKNAGKTKKQDKRRCVSCNCKYKENDTFENFTDMGEWLCGDCNNKMMMKNFEVFAQEIEAFLDGDCNSKMIMKNFELHGQKIDACVSMKK